LDACREFNTEVEMGATVIGYWPEMTERQLESQPGFWNDDRAWANWMVEQEQSPALVDAIRKLNAEAILTYKTDGMEDEDVDWVSPRQLRDAAEKLREAVLAGSIEAVIILETYERGANRLEAVREEFIRDLNDIISIANWCEKEGATRLTLEVNW
jgi:hypothetical protein